MFLKSIYLPERKREKEGGRERGRERESFINKETKLIDSKIIKPF